MNNNILPRRKMSKERCKIMSSEIIDRQNEIIKGQSNIISKLYNLLSQYMTIDDLENVTIIDDIVNVAKQKVELYGEE